MHNFQQRREKDPKPKRIKLKGKAYSDLRKAVWKLQYRRCANCGKWVILEEAHLHHKKTKGSGGDDTAENTEILCWYCHMVDEHGPRWSKGCPLPDAESEE